MLPMEKGEKGQQEESELDQNLSPLGLVQSWCTAALENRRKTRCTDIFGIKATLYQTLQSLPSSSFSVQSTVQGCFPDKQGNS